MLRNIIATGMLIAGLAACTSNAAEPDPHPTPSPNPSGTPTEVAAVPAMPDAARAHTKAGAEAFVVYYWQVVNDAQRSLDVATLQSLSLPTCTGCDGGINALTDIADHHGKLVGGDNTVRVTGEGSFTLGRPFTMAIGVTNTPQKIITPGKRTILHPAGTTRMIITLVPQQSAWRVAELRER